MSQSSPDLLRSCCRKKQSAGSGKGMKGVIREGGTGVIRNSFMLQEETKVEGKKGKEGHGVTEGRIQEGTDGRIGFVGLSKSLLFTR